MDQSESNNVVAVRLATALNANRTTLLRYLDKGMPHDEPGARQWILAFKTGKEKTRKVKPIATVYPKLPVEGDDSESRYQRLKDAELNLAQEIRGIQEQVLPELVSQLAWSNNASEKREIERKMFQAQQALLALRKENRAYQKMISDIELKTLAAREGLVSLANVMDFQTKALMPVFSFLRSIDIEGEPRTISKEIHRRYTEAVDKFVSLLHNNPGTENE